MVEYVSVLYDSWLRATDAPSPGWPTVHPPSDLLLPQDILWWSCASQHASTVFTCISGLNDMLKRDQLCVCICHPALRQTWARNDVRASFFACNYALHEYLQEVRVSRMHTVLGDWTCLLALLTITLEVVCLRIGRQLSSWRYIRPCSRVQHLQSCVWCCLALHPWHSSQWSSVYSSRRCYLVGVCPGISVRIATHTECLPACSSPKSLISSLTSNSVSSGLQEAANVPFPKGTASTSSRSRTTFSNSLDGWSSQLSQEATLVRAAFCFLVLLFWSYGSWTSMDLPGHFDVSDVCLGY